LYGSAVGVIPVAAKALKGVGSSAYSAYKGVRRYFNKPRSYKPRKPKTSSKRRSDLDYKKWERDMRKPPSSRVHLKRRRGSTPVIIRYLREIKIYDYDDECECQNENYDESDA
jgi:hypothetical protein